MSDMDVNLDQLGIGAIEKHFKLNRHKGVDGKFSSKFEELKTLKRETEVAQQAKGKVFFRPTNNEIKFKKYRRSIFVSKSIKNSVFRKRKKKYNYN